MKKNITLHKTRSFPQKKDALRIGLQGSKHAFSRIFPAFLLFDKGILHNVPDILDVHIQMDVAKKLGYNVTFNKRKKTLTNHGKTASRGNFSIDKDSTHYSRSLINFLPLFANKNITLSDPEGCNIGKRDTTWYMEILAKFGFKRVYQNKTDYTMVQKTFKSSSKILINNKSYTSTSLFIISTLLTKSKVVAINPSEEPAILDMVLFLKQSGIDITWNSDKTELHIDSRKADFSRSAPFTLRSDRNEAITLLIAAIIHKKRIEFKPIRELYIDAFFKILDELDIDHKTTKNGSIIVDARNNNLTNKTLSIQTGHFPEISTDWQPLIAILAYKGADIHIEENVFEARFDYRKEYEHFGIASQKNSKSLHLWKSQRHIPADGPLEVTAQDLRCGAGLAILASAHQGPVIVSSAIQIIRGYERLEDKLTSISNSHYEYSNS